jgi:hypothetical protein
MESDGKGHLRQQENCILRGEKGKFCGTNWTTHHFDAAANWIDGEFSSILASPLRFLRLLDHLVRSRQHLLWNRESDLLRGF